MPGTPKLEDAEFLRIIAATPLVSVDLVIVRGGVEVLLGLRNNRPAQGFWFVPGGRIRKNETITAALQRVAQDELGLAPAFKTTVRLIGAFEHFYDDCFAGECGVSTHYVALGHQLDVPINFSLPVADAQHAELRWWPIAAALKTPQVHRFTRDYLRAFDTTTDD